MAKSAAAALLLLLGSGCATTPDATVSAGWRGPFDAGLAAEPRNRESSGLAASRHVPGLLWTHADSGGEPLLHALAADGALRGSVRLDGVPNRDWEDMAAFEQDGRAWLCVGDIGDNAGVRPHVLLHFLPEPEFSGAAREKILAPAYTLTVTYEDGPRDCESLAVDSREGAIYLLSKREPTPRLYRVPLAPSNEPVVARFVGEVPHLPKPNAVQHTLKIPTGRYRANPCAMDFAPDGSAAVVLTYGDVLIFPRAAGEAWSTALGRAPRRLPAHHQPQAEAACYSADGRAIFVNSEKTDRLLRYDQG